MREGEREGRLKTWCISDPLVRLEVCVWAFGIGGSMSLNVEFRTVRALWNCSFECLLRIKILMITRLPGKAGSIYRSSSPSPKHVGAHKPKACV